MMRRAGRIAIRLAVSQVGRMASACAVLGGSAAGAVGQSAPVRFIEPRLEGVVAVPSPTASWDSELARASEVWGEPVHAARIDPRSRCDRTGRGLFLAGAAGAWMGGLGAWALVDDPSGPSRRVKGDAGYTPAANTAYAIGSWLGSAAGVYLAGRLQGGCGSLGRAVAFALVPSAPLFVGRHEPYLMVIGIVLVAPFQSLAARTGFAGGP